VIKTTQIELLSKNYTIKSERDPERVKELAAYLDAKMKEIVSDAPDATLFKVAILSAFHITEELFKCRDELEETLNIMEEKTANILKMLEDSSKTFPAIENRQDIISI